MDNIKNNIFLGYDSEEFNKKIDITIKEEFEGLSAIFVIPKFKEFLVNEVNNINIIFQNELNNLSQKMIDSFKNENNDNDFFYQQDFFPIPQNKDCFFWHKESIFIDETYKKEIYYIEKLDNPNIVNDSNFYKIIKQKNNSENKIETETLFKGHIKLKKDAEKLFKMLEIL